MATKFSTNVKETFTLDYVKEQISVTGSVISGTYPEPGVAGSNIKDATTGMFQSVYDYPHLSQSAQVAFDITYGVRTGGEFAASVVSGTARDTQAKFNIYDQMAALMLGYDQTGSVRVFDVSGNFDSVNASSVMDAPVFINLSRLVTKDELQKGTFELKIDASAWADPQGFSTLTTITDSGSTDVENGLRILKETTSNTNVGILDRYRGIAAIQLSSSVVSSLFDYSTSLSYFVSGTAARSWDFEESIHSGTIVELSTALRHRIYNLEINNVTQLNTALYTVTANPSDFNYSSNPSYVDSEGKIRVKKTPAGALDPKSPAYAYVTGIGLYAADGELLAVAKLSKPVKKDASAPLQVGVKLTY